MRSTWTPVELRVRGGISPTRFFTAGADVDHQRHDGERTSQWIAARAGVRLPFGFVASAVWRKGTAVAAPSIRSDEAQDVDDRSVTGAWASSFFEVEASYSSNAGFRPLGYDQYPLLPAIGPSGRTNWVTVNARLALRQWFVIDGWYSSPQGTRPEGQPPTHSLINATLQSRFLPTYRSGIFGLKLQGSIENWSPGAIARDGAGVPVDLKGGTYWRMFIGLQIGAFTAYYDRYNVAGTRRTWYVPNLPIPAYASTFGVRWEFRN
ncbi:MAG: hypothetical protein HOP28_10895 [Gemmatimonadales bacterium]|nr:hypothetical protein [Gemmatimonadales bacterium]